MKKTEDLHAPGRAEPPAAKAETPHPEVEDINLRWQRWSGLFGLGLVAVAFVFCFWISKPAEPGVQPSVGAPVPASLEMAVEMMVIHDGVWKLKNDLQQKPGHLPLTKWQEDFISAKQKLRNLVLGSVEDEASRKHLEEARSGLIRAYYEIQLVLEEIDAAGAIDSSTAEKLNVKAETLMSDGSRIVSDTLSKLAIDRRELLRAAAVQKSTESVERQLSMALRTNPPKTTSTK